jgi:hypothetical protein
MNSQANPRHARGRQYQEFCDSLEREDIERYRSERAEKGIPDGDRRLMLVPLSALRVPPPPSDGDCWGPWKFHRHNFTLDYEPRDKHWWYQLDLEDCTSSAKLLDKIFQTSNKNESCLSREDVGHLIQALDDLLRPQSSLCGFGRGTTMSDPAKFLSHHTQSTERTTEAAA